MKHITPITLALAIVLLAACSTTPRNAQDDRTLREAAAEQLSLSSQAAARGRGEEAAAFLKEARRLAIACDDPELRVRTALAQGGIALASGDGAGAFAAWEDARAEAAAAGKPGLEALCVVYQARGAVSLLAAGRGGELPPGAPINVEEAKERAAAALPRLKGDGDGEALAWVTIGLAEKEGKGFEAAAGAFRKAMEIQAGAGDLSGAASDLYLLASVYSVAGRFDEAEAALREAIAFDRRGENSYGLAADWRALGKVFSKAGRTAEAAAAEARAAAIEEAAGTGVSPH